LSRKAHPHILTGIEEQLGPEEILLLEQMVKQVQNRHLARQGSEVLSTRTGPDSEGPFRRQSSYEEFLEWKSKAKKNK
jgi:hypothetical protein